MKNLAARYHAGQFRKGEDRIPYISHPQRVAETLELWGAAPGSDIIQIAWGHDLLEDTCVTESEILAVSGEAVLRGIKALTCPPETEKSLYLQDLADRGGRDILLVKLSDRINNSKDFVQLKGPLHAYQYLHKAECLIPALQQLPRDPVTENALKAWEELDEELRRPAEKELIRGCLLGGAAGDALGAPVEFMSKEEICAQYGPEGVTHYVEFPDGTGAVTDDTQMTLFTAEGILRACVRGRERGICHPQSVVQKACLRWLKTQGRAVNDTPENLKSGWLIKEKSLFSTRAPGMTCLSALQQKAIPAQNNSKGCGSVMRMAPAGLFYSPEEAYQKGCEFSAITHGHPTGITAGGAFAMLISLLRHGQMLEAALDRVEKHLEQFPEGAETLEALRKARRAGDITELGEGWVAEEALAIGVYCALHYSEDYARGVLAAVNITGDSDSTGSIAGNILGALNGEKGIPREWLKKLREYEIVSQTADDLALRFEKNPEGHVTENWWRKYPGF